MTNATVTVEQVERKKAEVKLPENDRYYGVIRITKSIPPHRPEVRISFTPFEKVSGNSWYSKNSYTSTYNLIDREDAQLLCATFRETAKMLEESARTLPSRSSAPDSISKKQ